MGFCTDEELLAAARHRVFLDTDPGFGQMWHELGLADVFAGHDAYVTIGERIGTPGCSIPTCGLRWETTLQPVVLDEWPVAPPPPEPFAFGTIATWRGAYAPIEYRGRRYGLRAHEFRRLAELPHLTGHRFELALDIDAGRQRGSPTPRKRRLRPRRPLRRHGHTRQLPPLRAKQLGGADGGEGDVRGEPQRLVQ